MFKLVTGLPGDGKTSNELWDFLHAEQYQGRPKYCTPVNGFDAKAHGVTEIPHIDKWQDLPEGSVIFCDEIQDFCGTNLGKEAPDWVQQLARHRHSGYDFISTTQSPMFLHPFARKLVKPHVHYHRPFNLQMCRYTWDNVQNDPTTRTAKNLGQRQLVKPNPKVFELYTSTVLDTHKAKPPYKILIVLALALLVLVVGGVFAFQKIRHFTAPDPVEVAAVKREAAPSKVYDSPSENLSAEDKPVWTEQSMKPRIPGLLYTAPVYDALTAPSDFPRVSACMSSKDRGTCNCFTQQGTAIDVPLSACYVFVQSGSFDPWLSGRKQQNNPEAGTTAARAGEHSPLDARSMGGQPITVVADNSRMPRTMNVEKADSEQSSSVQRRVR